MRLTVRTLLAWLDGVLPAEEQRQLSEKVSASQVASMLAERIRLSVGRSAVGAPTVDGRGLADDPNSAAEFLDNSLPADHLARFERICIDSDMHLSEVAACHKILAEIAVDPSVEHRLDELTRQRLRALVRERIEREPFSPAASAASGVHDDTHRESRETARALRAALGTGADDDSGAVPRSNPTRGSEESAGGVADGTLVQTSTLVETAGGGLGPMRKRSSQAAWVSAVIAMSLLATLVGVLAWSVVWRGGRRGGPPPVAVANAAADAEQKGAAAERKDAAVVPVDAVASAEPARPAAAEAVVAGDDAPPPAASTAPPPAMAADTTNLAVAAPPAPPAATPRMQPPVAAAPAAPAPAEPSAAATELGFVIDKGALLRFDRAEGGPGWSHAAVDTALQSGVELLVPPWCESTVNLRGVVVRLLPETNVVVRVDSDGTPRLDLLFGRAVVRGSQADSRIGVTAGGVSGLVTADPATKIAMEVGPDQFADAAAAPARSRGFITAGQRPFGWLPTSADGAVVQGAQRRDVPAGTAVGWRDGQAALMTGVSPPSWLEAVWLPDRLQKAAAETLAAKIAAGRPLLLSLRELTADRRIENRMIAAATLAIVGESDELVELLAAESSSGNRLENSQWLSLEAMAVPATLARGGEAAAGLHRALIDHGPRDKAELLWAMAHGFTDADIAAGADRVLVEALDAPSLMVRRYAFKSLCDITRPTAADRLRYRPDGLSELRRDGVAWWRGQLERGLIHR